MLGGLALFLYGMHVLGEGLSKASGGRLEQIPERMTYRRWRAVLLGIGVTAVIQSSSAATVMVVGFVNSGMMKSVQITWKDSVICTENFYRSTPFPGSGDMV